MPKITTSGGRAQTPGHPAKPYDDPRTNDAASKRNATPMDTLTKAATDSCDCVICSYPMFGNIVQCTNGHAMCEDCLKKLNTTGGRCPTCRESIQNASRNRWAETVMANVHRFKCIDNTCSCMFTCEDDALAHFKTGHAGEITGFARILYRLDEKSGNTLRPQVNANNGKVAWTRNGTRAEVDRQFHRVFRSNGTLMAEKNRATTAITQFREDGHTKLFQGKYNGDERSGEWFWTDGSLQRRENAMNFITKTGWLEGYDTKGRCTWKGDVRADKLWSGDEWAYESFHLGGTLITKTTFVDGVRTSNKSTVEFPTETRFRKCSSCERLGIIGETLTAGCCCRSGLGCKKK